MQKMTILRGYELDTQLVEVLIGLENALDKIPVDQWSAKLEREQMRQKTRYLQSLGARRENNIDVHDRCVSASMVDIPVRIYRPKDNDERLPILLYFHGSAWIRGDLDTHDDIAGRLAGGSICLVISVDYRLAPEHKFPAPVKDGFAVLKWVAEQANELNIDSRRIAVSGDRE